MGRLSTTECTYLPTYLGRCSPSSFLKAFLVTSSFLLLFSRFFIPVTASRPQ